MKKKISAFLASMLLLGSIGSAAMAEGMTPGTYEAAAQGFHGDVKLSVTVDEEKITAIDVLEHSETEGIGAAALPKLVEAVLANQTIGVDSVAGATVTSEAFKAAMTDALTQAGADMDKMTAAVAASELEDVQMDADVVVVGAGVCKNLAERLEAVGGTLLTNTPATELIVENGTVVGVKAEGEGKAYTIRAKAVVLASGGYGANDALVPDEYKKFVYAGHAGATGDAIKMVEELDADLINMDLVNTQPNSMILPSGLGQYCNSGVAGAYKAGAYMVNQKGERFFNESANAWDLMQAMKQNEAQYLIMDQTAFDNFNAGMTNSKIYTMEDVEKWLSDDYDGQPVMKHGATLAELCEKLNLPADAVEASAKAFNDCAAAQTADAFGRTPAAAQSEEGPFYALQMHIRYYASLGGLHINDNMQVLNTKREAIPGLYAAGEVVGGLEGDVYMGATLFGWAVASGYDAANAVNAVIAQ